MTSPSSAQRRPRLWWTKPARRTRSLPAQARDCATSRPETAAPGRTHCSFARLAAARTPSPSHTRAPSVRRRDALVTQAGLLKRERVGRQAELQVRRAVEVGPDVLQVLLEVPERERHGVDPTAPLAAAADLMRRAPRRQVGRRQLTAAETAAFPREEQRPERRNARRPVGILGVAMSHKDLVKRVISAVNERDVEAYLACCTDDIQLYSPVALFTGPNEGAAGIRRFFQDIEDASPRLPLGVGTLGAGGRPGAGVL